MNNGVKMNKAFNKFSKSILAQALFSMLLTSLFMTDVLAAKFYRFVDANGKKVVSSTLPPAVSQKGYEIVNEMGVILETVAPRKTAEQLRQDFLNKAKIEAERKRAKEQEQLDTILINSYTDISDIERARDNELTAKDRDIMLLKQNIRRLTRLLEDTQTRAAREERLGKALSDKIQADVKNFKNRIAQEGEEVLKVEDYKVRIEQRYASSIIRFSELRAEEQLRRYRPGDLATEDSRAIIYQCTTVDQCETAWQSGLRYANEYSTTELAWANDTTIMMRKPRKDKDVSIMLTRVISSSGTGASIIFEIRCNKSQKGEDLCESETVRSIEKGFLTFLK